MMWCNQDAAVADVGLFGGNPQEKEFWDSECGPD